MKNFAEIRRLYTPVQPAVQPADDIVYRELMPAASLLPFIYCYWELKTEKPLQDQFNYCVVADGCMDIFFELSRPHENYVMGFCEKYTEFPLGHSFHYIGIRFLPAMFPLIFSINAAELKNRFETLGIVSAETAHFIAGHLSPKLDLWQIKVFFDKYFLQLTAKLSFDKDKRLSQALSIIIRNKGVLNVETELDTGASPRHLRRLFEIYVGCTAKSFSRVVRFQNILKSKPSSQSLKENKLFFDAGYYDQAHFIKEFKKFYGVTPGRVFGR